jgi:hemerythrin-like domain-containing protein
MQVKPRRCAPPTMGRMDTDPVLHWHEEHAYFNRLLEQLRRQLDAFHRGERPDYQLMQDVVRYLREYGDRVHHPREDAAFERLARRCPELELPLMRLHQEHRVIARAGDTLQRHIDAILEGALEPRGELEAALATYLVYYGNHIALEEEEVLGRAGAALTAADWQAVREAAPSGDEYRALRRQIALEAS